jgi:hypothetical protein
MCRWTLSRSGCAELRMQRFIMRSKSANPFDVSSSNKKVFKSCVTPAVPVVAYLTVSGSSIASLTAGAPGTPRSRCSDCSFAKSQHTRIFWCSFRLQTIQAFISFNTCKHLSLRYTDVTQRPLISDSLVDFESAEHGPRVSTDVALSPLAVYSRVPD